jgi:AcrR family transcriptional regulator
MWKGSAAVTAWSSETAPVRTIAADRDADLDSVYESGQEQGIKPMRADARRNREAILVAAASAFAAGGATAPLEDIARQAGVGIGTLYRHFPTREDLVFAVYRREVDRLCAAVPELLATRDPATATREWMIQFVDYAATKRGLITLLRSMMDDDRDLLAQPKASLRAAAGELLAAAAEAGVIRADTDPDDLTRALGGICMTGEGPDWKDKAIRLVDLVYDGLRYGAPRG